MTNSFSITDIGKKRTMNQDYVYSSDSAVGNLPNLYIVADGMGGHRAGDFASRFAVQETVLQIEDSDRYSMREIIDLALHNVNAALHRRSRMVAEYRGCGTTIVVACVRGNMLQVANVGDSRLYIAGDKIRQVTVDHSLVEEMVLAGSLDANKARVHPDKNVITRAVGAESYIDVDFFACELHSGEIILMCTDGLTNMVEDEEILRIIRETQGTLKDKGEALIAAAKERGGTDNITVTLVDPGI